MRDLYGDDDYESVALEGTNRLIPDGLRRLSGAVIFLGLVAAMGLWSYRLGTRDAGEVPIIRAMEGPSRVEPENPGGLIAPHQGLEVNAVLAGRPAPMPRDLPTATAEPAALSAEDATQGELIHAAPAAMAERVLGAAIDRPVAPVEEAPAFGGADGPEGTDPLPGSEGPAASGPRPMNRPANLVIARASPVAPAPARETREVSALEPGSRLVQLGAFDSEAITRSAWEQLVARNGDLLGTKSLYIERTTANARVFYRLRVAGFESSEQTRQMCEALRARGIDCIPVTLP